MSLLQIIILFTSVTAIGLTQQPWRPKLEKFAPVVGLASQPIWLYETFTAGQYGMMINSLLITVVWLIGIKRHWFSVGAAESNKLNI